MCNYHPATICLNGHVISGTKPNVYSHCSKCGAETISNCPNCNAPIHGQAINKDGYVSYKLKKPDSCCYNCGKPYPWTERIIRASVELLSMDENLDEDTKELLKTLVPDLLFETPMSQVAATRFKINLSKASEFVCNGLHQLFWGVVNESLFRIIFPQWQQ